MSTSGGSASPLGPLSVGNVVSAGVRIYRSHLQRYFMLALLAYVWLFVPIYGWAKYSAINGQLSRLAFQELINQPESNEESRSFTNPRMWSFLAAGLLMGLIFFGVAIALAIVIGIVAAVGAGLAVGAPALGLLGGLLIFAVSVAAIVFVIWLYARLLIVEVPLAIEPSLDAASTIGRSWNLTKGSVGRIMGVVFVAFLITLLVNVPVQVASFALDAASQASPESPVVALLSLALFVVSVLSGALLLPFWQVIKAVIYYDLRSRREGLGLELRSDRKR
ncbi:MAG: DUF975 domain-containing protein [Microcoleus sp. SIO2G3]|nr:DUF975 domain-containing protein [Microcoleus sp. SIO2G3]